MCVLQMLHLFMFHVQKREKKKLAIIQILRNDNGKYSIVSLKKKNMEREKKKKSLYIPTKPGRSGNRVRPRAPVLLPRLPPMHYAPRNLRQCPLYRLR